VFDTEGNKQQNVTPTTSNEINTAHDTGAHHSDFFRHIGQERQAPPSAPGCDGEVVRLVEDVTLDLHGEKTTARRLCSLEAPYGKV
jgi:hypothetical protein